MTFRRTLLALAFPALFVAAGCNPPIDEAGKNAGTGTTAPAATGGEMAPKPTSEMPPADAKPAMPPVTESTPAPATPPADAPKGEEPKMEPPK